MALLQERLLKSPPLRGTSLDADKARIIHEGLEAYPHHAGSHVSALIDPSGAILIEDGSLGGVSIDALAVCSHCFSWGHQNDGATPWRF